MSLTDAQIDRYSRQIILPEVGGLGQQRLLAARVLLVGEGSIVAWTSRYLVAAGIGKLFLVRADAALPASLRALNPECRIETSWEPAPTAAGDSRPAERRLPHAVVVAGRAEREFELVQGFWTAGVPAVLVNCGAEGGGGVTATSSSHPESPCLRCAAGEPNPPSEGASAAAFQATAFVSTLAATEVLKLLLGVGHTLFGRRLRCDALAQRVSEESFPHCAHRLESPI